MKHKEYSNGFAVELDDATAKMIEDAQRCSAHLIFYAAFDVFGGSNKLYRLYRRGKNRCHRCGVKLNQ